VIAVVGVVVPAHDEEAAIPACLVALMAAARRISRAQVRICVVADACSDQTAECARLGGASVVEIRRRSVGAARAAGMDYVLSGLRAVRPEAIWLATTDADSRVPAHWLSRQLEYAEAGYDAVAGTIAVTDWTEHPPQLPGIFAARYRHDGPSHPHVHGANLGVRASAYLAAGGFKALRTAEDHDLLHALSVTGTTALRASDIAVETSSRRSGRAPHGFSHLLGHLAAQAMNVPAAQDY
jgi:glycosyltransferase involved in cell wall biosynthesis